MTLRIAVITDIHANLPALDAALAAIAALGCDEIVHTGDAIGIGPFPAETLDRLLGLENSRFVMGNHDAWFANDLPDNPPAWMEAGELAHHRWVHAQLTPEHLRAVASWPDAIEEDRFGTRVLYTHYGRPDGLGGFAPIVRDPSPDDLDGLFDGAGADFVFYGHHHPASDLIGQARYVNPGSLGCHDAAVARFAVLDVESGGLSNVQFHEAPYDSAPVLRVLEERQVPERELIRQAFLRFR